jgi:guanosine-3',5'-bis(diphosphate) 3'-pyrophosphohydrolase
MEKLIQRASEFARRAHDGQQYGTGSFHQNHLARVVATLQAFGETDEVKIAAAWLHDAVEDTDVTVADVRAEFGDDVADLVWRLTDEKGGNRRERHAKTHQKIREKSDAVRVKLADRIANVESSIEQRTHLFGMYKAEHPAFREHLYREGEFPEMWQRLDGLLTYKPPSEDRP